MVKTTKFALCGMVLAGSLLIGGYAGAHASVDAQTQVQTGKQQIEKTIPVKWQVQKDQRIGRDASTQAKVKGDDENTDDQDDPGDDQDQDIKDGPEVSELISKGTTTIQFAHPRNSMSPRIHRHELEASSRSIANM